MPQPKGDILVFLTVRLYLYRHLLLQLTLSSFYGQDENEAAHENLTETARALGNKIADPRRRTKGHSCDEYRGDVHYNRRRCVCD
jgi:hypothetical protein